MDFKSSLRARPIAPRAQASAAVSLLTGRTGVPAFVVLSDSASSEEPILVTEPSRLAQIIPQNQDRFSKMIHHFLKGFFEIGGSEALLIPIRFDSKLTIEQNIVGYDRGPNERKGLLGIKSFGSHFDLVLIPQAAFLCNDLELGHIQQVLVRVCESHSFALALLDFNHSMAHEPVVDSLKSEAAALFYPWVSLPEIGVLPASLVAAALIQRTDKEYSISRTPAGQRLPHPAQPSLKLTPQDEGFFDTQRVNTFRPMGLDRAVLWGHWTTTGSNLSTIRVNRHLKEAFWRLCEPFLMESQTPSTVGALSDKLNKFMSEMLQRGILVPAARYPGGYYVDVRLGSASRKELPLEIEVQYSIENPKNTFNYKAAEFSQIGL